MIPKIDHEFKTLIPALETQEFDQLEKNILADGCRDSLVTWNGFLIDGHNRLSICHKHNLPYETVEKYFDSKGDVIEWIIMNQFGRRNINSYQRGVLALQLEDIYKVKAKENLSVGGKSYKPSDSEGLPTLAKVTPVDTRKEVARQAGISHGTIDKIKVIEARATPEVKELLSSGAPGVSIDKEYTRIIATEKRANNELLKAAAASMPDGVYEVIVIDPPWDMEKIERDVAPNQTGFDYPTMTHEEIGLLELPAADDCHLFCWTTHKHLPPTLEIIKQWGFKYVCLFTWHKSGGFQPFNLPQYNSEFVLYCRKGAPKFSSTKAFNTCFEGKRREHSRKPDEFYEIIERVTEGQQRIDIFSREQRKNWAQFGNEVEKF